MNFAKLFMAFQVQAPLRQYTPWTTSQDDSVFIGSSWYSAIHWVQIPRWCVFGVLRLVCPPLLTDQPNCSWLITQLSKCRGWMALTLSISQPCPSLIELPVYAYGILSVSQLSAQMSFVLYMDLFQNMMQWKLQSGGEHSTFAYWRIAVW